MKLSDAVADEFQVTISGEVESGSFCEELSSAKVHYFIVPLSENGWTQCSGESSGGSIKCNSSSTEFVWNVPISVCFSSPTPAGWPRLIISVFTVDWKGREILYGYGFGVIPSQPGRHSRQVPLYAPESTSWWGSLSGWLLGKRPMLVNPIDFFLQTHCKDNGSVVMRPISEASVLVNYNISIKNAENLNLRFC
jgi:B9 domain-containing protein 1